MQHTFALTIDLGDRFEQQINLPGHIYSRDFGLVIQLSDKALSRFYFRSRVIASPYFNAAIPGTRNDDFTRWAPGQARDSVLVSVQRVDHPAELDVVEYSVRLLR